MDAPIDVTMDEVHFTLLHPGKVLGAESHVQVVNNVGPLCDESANSL